MTKFKVFSASVRHESHSFCILPGDLASFREYGGYKRDDEIRQAFRGTRTEWGAIFDLAEEFGWEVTHPLDAITMVTGPVTRDAYEHFSDIILPALRRAMPVHGLLLPLHGAMLTEHVDDAEGELLRRIREIVGTSIPIAVTLDLHGNIGPALARHADIVSTYRTTPHVDMYETAERAGRLLQRTMNGEIRPTVAYAQGRMFDALDQGRTISGKGRWSTSWRRPRPYLRTSPTFSTSASTQASIGRTRPMSGLRCSSRGWARARAISKWRTS